MNYFKEEQKLLLKHPSLSYNDSTRRKDTRKRGKIDIQSSFYTKKRDFHKIGKITVASAQRAFQEKFSSRIK